MLNKRVILDLLEERGQKPIFINKAESLLETESCGIFYILEYKGVGGEGYTVSHSRVKEISKYTRYSILFINGKAGVMYLVLGASEKFQEYLNMESASMKESKSKLRDFNIRYENFDEYVSGF